MLKILSDLYPQEESNAITYLVLNHFGYSRQDILLKGDTIVDSATVMQINKITTDLKLKKPVQYILGETFFLDLVISVNESVLIPRQETEELCDMIIRENRGTKKVICDIGTGSGCIAVALAKYLPGSEIHATDISRAALGVAANNAGQNQCRIYFHHADLLSDHPLPDKLKADVIVSNPPYVAESEKKMMMPQVRDHEPEQALFVPDNDPLLFYRRISELIPVYLKPGGVIWLEINERFGKETAKLFEKKSSGFTVFKDLRNKERFIKVII